MAANGLDHRGRVQQEDKSGSTGLRIQYYEEVRPYVGSGVECAYTASIIIILNSCPPHPTHTCTSYSLYPVHSPISWALSPHIVLPVTTPIENSSLEIRSLVISHTHTRYKYKHTNTTQCKSFVQCQTL